MGVPIPTDATAQIADLSRKVERLSNHRHPGGITVSAPTPVTGDRSSDTVDILRQVLAVLDAAGIIVDQTTG